MKRESIHETNSWDWCLRIHVAAQPPDSTCLRRWKRRLIRTPTLQAKQISALACLPLRAQDKRSGERMAARPTLTTSKTLWRPNINIRRSNDGPFLGIHLLPSKRALLQFYLMARMHVGMHACMHDGIEMIKSERPEIYGKCFFLPWSLYLKK
jgi:hypothetical protein